MTENVTDRIGAALACREAGQGTPFVFLHGNGEDGSYFSHQIEHFSRRYHVYAPDTRGHGQSPRGTAPFTIAQFAEDLLAFFDAHEIARAIVLGFSDGANIAMQFVLRHPERVLGLILDGGNLDPHGVKRSTQLPIELGYRLAGLKAERSEQARRKRELLALMVEEPHLRPEALRAIRVPTLVLAGTHDMIRLDHTRLIAHNIPGAVLRTIPGSHFVAHEHPVAFDRAVDDFLREAGL